MTSAQGKSSLYGDASVIRLVAAQIFVLGVFALFFQSRAITAFLLVDFGIRAWSTRPSLLKWFAQQITSYLRISPKPIFLPPKRFAALLGFIFSALWLLFLVFDKPDLAFAVGTILLICAFLESVFQLCVGCYVYSWVVAPWLQKREN